MKHSEFQLIGETSINQISQSTDSYDAVSDESATSLTQKLQ